jgi:hypothetical protein
LKTRPNNRNPLWGVQMPDTSADPEGKDPEPKYPPILGKAIYWIGGLVALVSALTALTDGGQRFIASAIGLTSEIGTIFKSPPSKACGDLPWEEWKKCVSQQQ